MASLRCTTASYSYSTISHPFLRISFDHLRPTGIEARILPPTPCHSLYQGQNAWDPVTSTVMLAISPSSPDAAAKKSSLVWLEADQPGPWTSRPSVLAASAS